MYIKWTKEYYTYHSDDRTTFRSLLSPDFFDPFIKEVVQKVRF